MNRFRTKKKAKDTTEAFSRPSNDSEAPSNPTTLKPSMTFKRGKKAAPEREEKVELDLTNALPPADDFRTSLLMTGLSARFSMLRDQDDPKTKIGKASDDSVLSPKRQSRLGNFGFQPNSLADIAEVASIKDSIKRPFALERTESYNSLDYGTDDDSANGGSVLNRHKHGEGNNLFGGRQKIYRIPLSGSSSTKNLADETAGMSGRALYDRDVSQSTFQTIRDEEKAKREQEQEQATHDDTETFSLPRRSESPSFPNYNRNRETSSTSSSGPSLTRSSTAATSVTSQRSPSVNGYSSPSTPAVFSQPGHSVPERTTTKAKRLYETGLDQHLHNQQFSSINRLDGLSRQRTLGARPPSPGLSLPNGPQQDIPHINTGISQTNHNSGTPPQSTTNTGAFDFGVKTSSSLQAPKLSYGVSPPLSPPMSEADEQTILPIQPNDKGKATALGTFQKPVSPYDENKYTQRQLQMQQGRETPPLRRESPRSFNKTQQPYNRLRAESHDAFSPSRSASSTSPMQTRLAQSRPFVNPAKNENFLGQYPPKPSGTFLESPSGSSKMSDLEPGEPWAQPTISVQTTDITTTGNLNGERPPESEHPAHRKTPPHLWIEDSSDVAHDRDPATSGRDEMIDSDRLQREESDLPADSPTLGPASNGLSGLVSQHLRSDSNTSSIYGAPSPAINSRFYSRDPMPEVKYSTHGNPWATSNFDSEIYDRPDGPTSGIPEVPGEWQSSHPAEATEQAPWEKEMAAHHTRNASSETQKERRDFAHELAARRKRVQENLRSFVESDSRSASPAPGAEMSKENVALKSSPLGILKPKSSRGSLVIKTKEGPSKAMKMLGIGNTTISSAPSPIDQRSNEHLWKEEEEEMLRGIPLKSPRTANDQIKAMRQARREAQRDRERQVLGKYQYRDHHGSEEADEAPMHVSESPARHRAPSVEKRSVAGQTRQRNPSEERSNGSSHEARATSRESKHSVATSNRSASSRPSRDRSSSDTSERSKSRNGRYRDDLAKAMAEGVGSSAQGSFEDLPSARTQGRSPGLAVPYQPSPAAGSPTLGTPMGYSQTEQLQPIQTPSVLEIGLSPRPSPVTPFSVNSTPALSPNGSSTNTPTGAGFQSEGRLPPSLKRPVNKADISDPIFVSTTSQITTITLNVAAAQQSALPLSAPPLPPMDPRRRQTRTQAMLGVLKGKSAEVAPMTSPLPTNGNEEERSVFSADEAEEKPKPRQKLRKSSSDGANLNSRAQKAFNATPSPALPNHTFLTGPSTPVTAVHATFPTGAGQTKSSLEGGMF